MSLSRSLCLLLWITTAAHGGGMLVKKAQPEDGYPKTCYEETSDAFLSLEDSEEDSKEEAMEWGQITNSQVYGQVITAINQDLLTDKNLRYLDRGTFLKWDCLHQATDEEAFVYLRISQINDQDIPPVLVDWIRSRARQRYVGGQMNFAFMHEYGLGVNKNDNQAFYWYSKAAKRGHLFALTNLGRIYQTGVDGFVRCDRAYIYYRKAARRGFPSAQNKLGELFQNIYKNDQEAFPLYVRAAEQGHALGQNNLAWMYANGKGVEQDAKKAAYWYRKSAIQGNPIAQTNLGLVYAQGFGVNKNMAKAFFWYSKAASQGYAHGQYRLGQMFENGYGEGPHKEEAIRWYVRAALQGFSGAIKKLQTLLKTGENFDCFQELSTNYLGEMEWLSHHLLKIRESHSSFLSLWEEGQEGDILPALEFLAPLTRRVIQMTDDYLKVLNNLDKPFFMLSCLEMGSVSYSPSFITTLKATGKSYVSFESNPYTKLAKCKLAQKLAEIFETLQFSYSAINQVAQENDVSNLSKNIYTTMLDMHFRKTPHYSFFEHVFNQCIFKGEFDQQKEYLHQVSAQLKVYLDKAHIIDEQIKFALPLNKEMELLIDKTAGVRNRLFLEHMGFIKKEIPLLLK